MTKREAEKTLRAIGMRLTKTEFGEYRVTFRRSVMPYAEQRELHAYYTMNLDDAVDSGRQIAAAYHRVIRDIQSSFPT